ncbi:MAG: hypothetical protein WCO48_02850 [Candidatus Taylorbacteria bacterium]
MILILDIQSSSVRGSLVAGETSRASSSTRNKTIFEIGIEIPYRVSKDSKTLTENILEAVKVIVQGIMKDLILRREKDDLKAKSAKISAVHCVISSPWLISQAQIVSTTFKKETKITDKIVDSMLDNKKAKPTLHITEEAHRTGQLKTIEKKVFSVILNGYPTTAWQNKKAKTLDVSFVVSSASSHFMAQLEEICATVTPGGSAKNNKNTKFHSSLILHYIASTNLVPDAAAHVCVHIHNEITDIISISKTGNIYFASYPVGLRTIARRISVAMGVRNHTAESMLALYADMHLDIAHNRTSSVIIDKVLQGWSREYHEFLKMAEVPHNSPVHIFVSAEKYPKLFARLMRIPSSKAKVEPITEDIYPEAINML